VREVWLEEECMTFGVRKMIGEVWGWASLLGFAGFEDSLRSGFAGCECLCYAVLVCLKCAMLCRYWPRSHIILA
jgi:hypothetical protein